MREYLSPDDAGAAPPTAAEASPAAPPTAAEASPATTPPATTAESAPPAGIALPKWADQLKPELRKSLGEKLAAYPTLSDLAEGASRTMDELEKAKVGTSEEVARQKALLERAVILPDMENPDPEERNAFFTKLGIPTSEDGYEIEAPAGAEDYATVFKTVALKAGLSRSQAAKMFDHVMKAGQVGKAQIEDAVKAARAGFEENVLTAVGGNKDKRSELLNRYQRGLTGSFSAELISRLDQSGIMYDPTFAAAIAELDRRGGDPVFADGSPTAQPPKKGGGILDHSAEFEAQFGSRGKR